MTANTPSHFMLQKPELTAALLAVKHSSSKLYIYNHLLHDVNRLNLISIFFAFSSQIEKSQALEFILHVADISNPAKDWELHRQWTSRIMEEFFCQVNSHSRPHIPPRFS